jgi:PAS domain S-box-containing protein
MKDLSAENRSPRRRVDDEARIATQRRHQDAVFSQLAEVSDEIFWMVSPDWRRLYYVSPAYETLVGRSRRSLYADPASWLSAVVPEDRIELRRTLQGKGRHAPVIPSFPDFRIRAKDKTIRWIRLRCYPMADPDGAADRIVGCAQDITDFKTNETALENERFKLREYFDNLPLLAYNIGLDGTIKDCNRVAVKTLGYQSKDNLIGRPVVDTIYDSSCHDRARRLFRKWQRDKALKNEELRIRTRAGDTLDVLLNVDTIYDRSGKAVSSLSTQLDITKWRKTTELLAERERSYRTLLANLPGMAYRCCNDGDRTVEFVSDGCFRLTGYRRREILTDLAGSYGTLIHPEDRSRARAEIQQAVARNRRFRVTYRILTRDGKTRWVWEQGVGVPGPDGQIAFLEGFIADMDERVRAQQKAIDRLELLETLLDTIPNPVFYKDRAGRYHGCNEAFARKIIGAPKSRIIGSTLLDFPDAVPRGLARAHDEKDAALFHKPGTQVYEATVRCADGLDREFMFSKATYLDSLGQVAGLVGVMLDVTERRAMEQKLRESERLKSLVLDATSEMFAYYDLEQRIIWANRASAVSLGLAPEELVGRHCYELWHERNAPCDGCPVLRAVVSGREEQLEIQVPDGRWFFLRGYPVYDNGGAVVGSVEFTQDITERRRIEEALRSSEATLGSIFMTAPIGIAQTSVERVFTRVNKRLCDMLGYKPEELIGRGTRLVYPTEEDYRSAARERFPPGSSWGPDTVETRWRRKDGSIIEVLLSSALLLPGDPEAGMTVAAVEITERKGMERELEASREKLRTLSAHLQEQQENERTALAQEIHDNLGQALTAVRFDVAFVKRRLGPCADEAWQRIESLEGLLDRTIQEVKRIHAELRPSLLDDLGLEAALEWQAEEFERYSGIRTLLKLERAELSLEPKLAMVLFRVVREALTNVSRHSGATKVTVSLQVRERSLELRVADNGRGITEEEIRAPRSFGILGMQERLAAWGGAMTLRGRAGKGTTLTAVVPLPR